MDLEWIRLAVTIIAYGAWFAPMLVGMVNKYKNGRLAPMGDRETYSVSNDDYQEPDRNVKRRKVGGLYWGDKLEAIERRSSQAKSHILNAMANNKPLDQSMMIEIINKMDLNERDARELRRYDGGQE